MNQSSKLKGESEKVLTLFFAPCAMLIAFSLLLEICQAVKVFLNEFAGDRIGDGKRQIFILKEKTGQRKKDIAG